MKRISVIVPTFKRPEYLNRTLATLANQKTSVKYDVLVVDDDGLDPRAKNIAQFWSNYGPIKYLTPGHDPRFHGRTRIRNFGIRYADAEILVFLDDDMLVPLDFVEEHSRSHDGAAENKVVIGYRNHLKVSPNFLEHINPMNLAGEMVRFSELPSAKDEREDIYQLCQGDLQSLAAPWTILYSNNFSLRRRMLDKIGGLFNESFQGAWGGEDVELGYRLHKAGAKYALNRKAVGYHQWHYANWRRNMQSLHTNLRRFFMLYPSPETELYVNYPETGLPTYFKDLKNYVNSKISDTAGLCEKKEVLSCLQKKLTVGSEALLIGAGNARSLLDAGCFTVYTDPRATFRWPESTGKKQTRLQLVGCHLPYEDNAFENVVMTNFISILSTYHRSMAINEACRLAKNKVIVVIALKELKSLLTHPAGAFDQNELVRAFRKWSGVGPLVELISIDIVEGVLIATIGRSILKLSIPGERNPAKLALIMPADSQDSHTEQAIELMLALAKSGGDIAIQLEDHKRQSIIFSETFGGMNRFSKEDQILLRQALTKDLRGRNHLFPRLSLTGNYHYHGKRVDWVMENKIGLLSAPYVQGLNEESDAVWIPSGKVAQLFDQSGVHGNKIKELPIAVPDHLVLNDISRNGRKRFRFLAIGTVEKADGLDVALEAFCAVAKNLPHSELIIRIFPIENREVTANDLRQNMTVRLSHLKHQEHVTAIQQYRVRRWKQMVKRKGLSTQISFENINHGFRCWPTHLESIDCLIQTQRVDVTGHWILRAMARGIPVITAGRYLPNNLKGRLMNYFVQNREVSAADREWASNVVYTRWTEPQIDNLSRHISHVFRNRKEAWARAELAQKYVKKRLTWSRVIEQYANDLRRIGTASHNGNGKVDPDSLFDQLKINNLINLEEEPFERR